MTNKKYNRTFHLRGSPGATNDDKIASDISSMLNVPVIITEKLDGENTGLTRDGVYARSHETFTTSPWTFEIRQMHNMLKSGISEGVTIFGEGMEAIHSIEYTNLMSYFYMFGVRDNETWLSWDDVEEYAFMFDLPTAPVLFKGIFHTEKELYNVIHDLMKHDSVLGGEREGVVIRKASAFEDSNFSLSVMKWVRANHVTTDKHWSRNWRRAHINTFPHDLKEN